MRLSPLKLMTTLSFVSNSYASVCKVKVGALTLILMSFVLFGSDRSLAQAQSCQRLFLVHEGPRRLAHTSAALEQFLAQYRDSGVNVTLRIADPIGNSNYRFDLDQVRDFLSVIPILQRRLSGVFEIPGPIELILYDRHPSPIARWGNPLTIEMGLQKGFPSSNPIFEQLGYTNGLPGYARSPIQAKVALAHELGHLFFHSWLRQIGNPIATLPEVRMQTETELYRLENSYPAIKDLRLESNLIPPEVQARYLQLRAQLAHVLSITEIYGSLYLDYHEIFADVIELTSSQDPRAMANSLRYIHGPSANHPDAFSRRFDRTVDRLTDAELREKHNRFNVVRSFIWRNYLQRLHRTPRMGLFVQRFLSAIDLELRELAAHPELRVGYEDLNQRLISRIQSIARDL